MSRFGAFDGNAFDDDAFDTDIFEPITPPTSGWIPENLTNAMFSHLVFSLARYNGRKVFSIGSPLWTRKSNPVSNWNPQ